MSFGEDIGEMGEMGDTDAAELVDAIFHFVFFSPKGVNGKHVANKLQIPLPFVSFVLKELAYDGTLIQRGTWYYG